MLVNGELGSEKHGPFTLHQLQQLYHQQLLHQMQEAENSRNELSTIRNQLKVEMDSRMQAQVTFLFLFLFLLFFRFYTFLFDLNHLF